MVTNQNFAKFLGERAEKYTFPGGILEEDLQIKEGK